MSTKSLNVFLLIVSAVTLIATTLIACNNESTTSQQMNGDNDLDQEAAIDSDSNPETDHQDMDVDPDEGEATDQPVARKLVEGTHGFCTLPYPLDTSCSQASDCIGMRIPVPVDCQGDPPLLTRSDCIFVNGEAHPSDPSCTADSGCAHLPRDCVDGYCVYIPPPDQCTKNEDCALVEPGCACWAISAEQENTYDPNLGLSCTSGACPDDAYPQCLYGHCRKAGSFMDEKIQAFCEFLSTCSTETDLQRCVDGFMKDEYKFAAAQWSWIEAALLAETCSGVFFGGPGTELYKCMFTSTAYRFSIVRLCHPRQFNL